MVGRTNANVGISTSDATATASQILTGKTAYVNGSKITGSMVDNGAVSQALNCGGSYTIPAGYHNGSGKVTANSLASQTDGTATAAQILKDQTAYVDGSKITGTMPDNGAVAGTITGSGNYYMVPRGYHNGLGRVTGPTLVSLISADNVTLQNASNLLQGNTAYGKNGVKYVGSMVNKSGVTEAAAAVTSDDTYTYLSIPVTGYYSTTSKIKTLNSNLGYSISNIEFVNGIAVSPNGGTKTISLEQGKTYFISPGHVMGGILTFKNASILEYTGTSPHQAYIITTTGTSITITNSYTGTTYDNCWNIYKLSS